MSFLQTIKATVGDETYSHVEKEAEKEVALAKQMPLQDKYHQEKYYSPRFIASKLLAEFELFEKVGLKISPTDLVKILFKCKLLFACQTEKEFGQRCGGLYPSLVDSAAVVRWAEKSGSIDAIVEQHVNQLEAGIGERILLAHVSSFKASTGDPHPHAFFEKLFVKVDLPFMCFLNEETAIEQHQQFAPGLISYDQNRAKEFFSAPSFGFKCSGSRDYCFWYSTMWLRTFLNLLRIGGYINPGQIGFGLSKVEMIAPTFPVFLGDHSTGFYKWDEDKQESWAKIPDGCLFRSFGYRGLSEAWFDRRTFPGLEEFFRTHRRIFDNLRNPWNARNLKDVAPTLDILSSATQMPDVGAKILLIYCCLEHLFVPRDAKTDNRKYIVGGMNALAPQHLTWFNRLYDLRCDYAHKGFVLRDDGTMGLIRESMKNVLTLLIAKLSVS